MTRECPKMVEPGSPVRDAAFHGRELATVVRNANLDTVDDERDREVMRILVRMIDAPARTPADALALAMTTQTLVSAIVARNEVEALDLAGATVNMLLQRLIETLEQLAGLPGHSFTGGGPAIN